MTDIDLLIPFFWAAQKPRPVIPDAAPTAEHFPWFLLSRTDRISENRTRKSFGASVILDSLSLTLYPSEPGLFRTQRLQEGHPAVDL